MPCLKKAPPEFTGLAAARRRALLRTGAALTCLSALPAWAQADEAQPETSPEMGVETGAGMKAEMSVETGPDRPPAAPAAEMAGRAEAGASAPESTENSPSDARQSDSQASESALPESPAQPANAATLAELRTRREADGSLLLTARVRFALAPALEQALLKGVPLHFMAEAVVLRSRWYWRDRRLAARRWPADRPGIIAVDGRSGAGKTTVTSRLTAVVPDARVLHIDDLDWNEPLFQWDRLLVAALTDLRRDGALDMTPPA